MKKAPKYYRVTWRLFDHGNGCDMCFEVSSHRLLRCNEIMQEMIDWYKAQYPEDIQIMDWQQQQIDSRFQPEEMLI